MCNESINSCESLTSVALSLQIQNMENPCNRSEDTAAWLLQDDIKTELHNVSYRAAFVADLEKQSGKKYKRKSK